MKKLICPAIFCSLILLTTAKSCEYVCDTKETYMPNKTTLIVTSSLNPEQQDALNQYVNNVLPLLFNLGGEVIKRSMVTDTYHGTEHFTFLLVMDFPSKTALVEMFESDAYQALIPDRDKAFKSIEIRFADDIE